MKEMTIKEEQNIQLEILKKFDAICRKEGLIYYLAYGTLLGAVREHGFIEWDDDVDIWMKRDDFEKFIKLYQNYADDKYFLQTYLSDKKMPVPGMTRICVNGTLKWPVECQKRGFHSGIYFDIFPLDYADMDDKKTRRKIKQCKQAYSMLWHKLRIKRKYSWKGKVFCLISILIPRFVLRNIVLNIKHKKYNPEKMVCYPVSFVFPKNIYDSKDFERVTELDFEDMKCMCPCGYEKILTERYGEWRIPSDTKPRHTKAYYL